MPAYGSATAQLAALGVRLKVAGAVTLRRELLRGIKTGAAPLIPAVRDAALGKLPKSGGLNRQVAGQKVTVSVRLGPRTAGVRLLTRAPDTLQTDRGFVRHPTFGRRGKGDWKTEQIPYAAGWWSETLAEKSPGVTPAILATMNTVAREVQGR